jgi:acyl-[acyl-carrier-protein] desaturase
MFYKGVMGAMLKEAPAISLEGIYQTFLNFQMPGVGIPGFLRRSIDVARAGVYNLRIHHDRVLMPLLEQWGIANLVGLSAKAAELQQRLMDLPDLVMQKAERFESRFAPA